MKESHVIPVKFDLEKSKKIIFLMKAVTHPLRKRMLDLLQSDLSQNPILEPRKTKSGSYGITVTNMYIFLRVEQSVASQHLRWLRKANAVQTERQGKNIVYYVIPESLEQIKKAIEDFQI